MVSKMVSDHLKDRKRLDEELGFRGQGLELQKVLILYLPLQHAGGERIFVASKWK